MDIQRTTAGICAFIAIILLVLAEQPITEQPSMLGTLIYDIYNILTMSGLAHEIFLKTTFGIYIASLAGVIALSITRWHVSHFASLSFLSYLVACLTFSGAYKNMAFTWQFGVSLMLLIVMMVLGMLDRRQVRAKNRQSN